MQSKRLGSVTILVLALSFFPGCERKQAEKDSAPEDSTLSGVENEEDLLESVDYFLDVDDVLVSPKKYAKRRFKMHGFVEAGSIARNSEEIRFILEHNGQRMRVSYRGTVPDTFRDKAEIIVGGKLLEVDGEFRFEAAELMAKCPEVYKRSE